MSRNDDAGYVEVPKAHVESQNDAAENKAAKLAAHDAAVENRSMWIDVRDSLAVSFTP